MFHYAEPYQQCSCERKGNRPAIETEQTKIFFRNNGVVGAHFILLNSA